MPDPDALPTLLARLPALFPESNRLELVPSAGEGAWKPIADRFAGGHAARWFAATDGQRGDRPAVDAHAFCSLADAISTMRIADGIRAEPDGYWVEPHWLAITTDLAGQHFMIDDHDGRVLAVAHDDDAVAVLAPSAEAWLTSLIEGHAAGTIVWDRVYGLTPKEDLARVHAAREARRARVAEPLPMRHKIGLALTMTGSIALSLLIAWWLEAHR